VAIVGRSIPNVPILTRGSLADDPVLTTPQPIVSTVPGKRGRPAALLLRAALVDDPVLTTQPPIVVTRQPPRPVGFAFVGRSSTEDVVAGPAALAPGPIVVTAQPRPRPGTVIAIRGTLADDPVLVTPPPLVVVQPARQRVATIQLYRSSLEDVVVASAATPQPLVTTYQPKPRPGTAVLFRGSLYDAATPAALVVVPASRRPGAVVALARGALVDPPVLVTAGPLVVAQPRPRYGGTVALFRTPAEAVAHSCSTTRPYTGITASDTGITARPDTGITDEPC
jgi:hypothetical protein